MEERIKFQKGLSIPQRNNLVKAMAGVCFMHRNRTHSVLARNPQKALSKMQQKNQKMKLDALLQEPMESDCEVLDCALNCPIAAMPKAESWESLFDEEGEKDD